MLAVAIFGAACGKSAKHGNDDMVSNAGAAGGPSDGSPSQKSACPQEPPSPSSACEDGAVCSYGMSSRRDCRQTFTCAVGEWRVDEPTCVQPPVGYCPPQNPSGQPCSALNEAGDTVSRGAGVPCEYQDVVCLCYGCGSRPCNDEGKSIWECSTPPADAPECPQSPPQLGMTCTTELTECTYGDPCTHPGRR